MARRALALLAISLVVLVAQALAANAEGELCSDTATVSWQTNLGALQVTGVFVEVIGCDDGEFVGIELLMDDGSQVPPAEPLGSEVEDDIAFFDLSELDVGIEPVVGIRVYLVIHGEPVPVASIIVEQRFFNQAGNEQFGLRVTTPLTVPFEQSYAVPSAGPGYQDVDCDEVNLVLDEADGPVVGWGAGDFVATVSGRHIACYEQVPGTPGGPSPGSPGAEEPEVLGVVLERDVANGDDHATVLGQVLARTGLDATHLVVIAAIALAGGILLLRRRTSPA